MGDKESDKGNKERLVIKKVEKVKEGRKWDVESVKDGEKWVERIKGTGRGALKRNGVGDGGSSKEITGREWRENGGKRENAAGERRGAG